MINTFLEFDAKKRTVAEIETSNFILKQCTLMFLLHKLTEYCNNGSKRFVSFEIFLLLKKKTNEFVFQNYDEARNEGLHEKAHRQERKGTASVAGDT